ncbi:hypothetical protein FQN49_002558 [Arthroderma sp. PD_2]|nr:hypothetical protein FQN49_002558 [Arthroderma sp. PD_2]
MSAVDSAQLSAFEHSRLKLFLNYAIDQSLASTFLLRAATHIDTENTVGYSIEENLRSILRNLHSLAEKFSRNSAVSSKVDTALRERQNNICYVSGQSGVLEATHIVSPSIIDDDDIRPGVRVSDPILWDFSLYWYKGALRSTLEATITPQMTDRLFSFLQSCNNDEQECLKNLWLMCPSVGSAFRGGRISMYKKQCSDTRVFWKIRKTPPGRYEVPGLPKNCAFFTVPSTPDSTRLPLPEGFLLATHRPISAFMHYMSIEKDIQSGWGSYSKDIKTPGKFGLRILRGMFFILPEFLKLKVTQLILKAVNRWKPQDNPYFKYLPWGLCLKIGNRVNENEANALVLIEEKTTVPAPKLIGFSRDNSKNEGYLIMTVVPGIPADSVYYRMTYEERIQLSKDLRKHILQYRQIQNPYDGQICDTLGGPTTDHRTDTRKLCGPYNTEDEFTDFLTEGLEDQRNKYPLRFLYEKHHDICFTHSDLHLSNIFLQHGKFSGLIDWESACFKPEYWEYTRAVWAYLSIDRKEMELSYAFDKSYRDELEAEKLIWMANPVF